MSTFTVSATTRIERPAHIVRRQFADVHHHEATGVHRGATFCVGAETSERCHYHQVTRVGPLRLRQEIELERTPDGPLVNSITKGPFSGGSISFTITPDGPDAANVHACLDAPTSALQAIFAPLLRSRVRRALSRALDEDKADLESGSYPAGSLQADQERASAPSAGSSRPDVEHKVQEPSDRAI